jgi:hypothetical protein
MVEESGRAQPVENAAPSAGKPRRPRWRGLLGWAAALAVLVAVIAFFALAVKPVLDVHEAVLRVQGNCTTEEFDAAVAGLGGPARAAGKLGLYCRAPRRAAPEREWAAWLLAHCGAKAVPHLLRLASDDDPDVRVAAMSGLGSLRDPRAVEPLLAALGSPHEAIRVTAARALGKIGDARAAAPLVAALKAREVAVRAAAAAALGRLADARAVAPLIAALGDESLLVREAAARALGGLADERAVPALEALAAREGASSAAAAAREAVEKLRAAKKAAGP